VTHDAAIQRVRDQRGYDAGFVARCTCGHPFPELRDTLSAAARDLWDHIADTRPTTETTD
jgi:hypothetical protein